MDTTLLEGRSIPYAYAAKPDNPVSIAEKQTSYLEK